MYKRLVCIQGAAGNGGEVMRFIKPIKRIVAGISSVVLATTMLFATLSVHANDSNDDYEYYASLDPNSDEYQNWKSGIASSSQNRAMLKSTLKNNTLISNDYIEFNTSSNGLYTIGTTGGNPSISSDNNKNMLYGHPGGRTSKTTINVNGAINQFTSSDITYDASNSKSIANSMYDGISVSQELTIIENSATGREDVVQIKYVVKNTTDSSQDVGLRIMMDTMLGSNDAAPFRVNGKNVTTETEYVGNSIPQIWQAFDTITNPGVVSQGTFYKSGDLKPDKVQFTNWGHVANTLWNYAIQNGYSNGDSAVSITWNKSALESGETREYVTYYGLSELEQDLIPPIALSVYADNKIQCTNNQYNNLNVNAYIENIGDGNATNVKLWIAPIELELINKGDRVKKYDVLQPAESKSISWKLSVDDLKIYKENTEINIPIKLQYTIESTGEVINKEINKTVTIEQGCNGKQAIIVVPGIMGSNLKDENGDILWAESKSNAAVSLLMEKLSCNSDGSSKNYVEVSKGNNEYGALDTYEYLIKALRTDYGEYYDVVFAAYDWRYGLDNSALELKSYIDNYDNVAIVAHSMGGLVTEEYIKLYGTNKIAKVVSVGTPFWGSIMSTSAVFDGHLSMLDEHPILSSLASSTISNTTYNFEGIYNLFPNQLYTKVHNWCSFETNQYENLWDYIFNNNYIMETYDWDNTYNFYQQDLYFNSTLSQRALNNVHNLYDVSVCQLDKVDTTYIVGVNTLTSTDAKYFAGMVNVPTTDDMSGGLGFNSEYMKVSNETPKIDGDGTVTLLSATMNRISPDMVNGVNGQKIGKFVLMNGVSHVRLVKDESTKNEIFAALDTKLVANVSHTTSSKRQALRINAVNDNSMDSASALSRLAIIGDFNIEFYENNELAYYYYSNGDVKQGSSITFQNAGSLGAQKIVIVDFIDNNTYNIHLTANSSQIAQIGLMKDSEIHTINSKEFVSGDIVDIFDNENLSIMINNSKYHFDNENVLTADNITVHSMNTEADLQYSNTLGIRIKIENNSDQDIELDDLVIGYLFDSDGYENNVFECDWAGKENETITSSVDGTIIPYNENKLINISFSSDDILQSGEKIEVHIRVHTDNWDLYDVTNDYSSSSNQYEVNSKIQVSYQGNIICGELAV